MNIFLLTSASTDHGLAVTESSNEPFDLLAVKSNHPLTGRSGPSYYL
jgi:hypothetical protein